MARAKIHAEQGVLLLTWFNFNPSMDRDEIAYSFLNFNGATVEV